MKSLSTSVVPPPSSLELETGRAIDDDRSTHHASKEIGTKEVADEVEHGQHLEMQVQVMIEGGIEAKE